MTKQQKIPKAHLKMYAMTDSVRHNATFRYHGRPITSSTPVPNHLESIAFSRDTGQLKGSLILGALRKT